MPRRRYASPACALGESGLELRGKELRVAVKRIYEPARRGDGFRLLVDRLWPRGIRRDEGRISAWAKDLAPSTELRQWLHQDPGRWSEFVRRYRKELRSHALELEALRNRARARPLTLVYAAKDTERNHARVLQSVLEMDADGTKCLTVPQ